MNTTSKLLVAATLLATLSIGAGPAMAAASAKKAAAPSAAQAQSQDIPLLMPPIVIIGKRMTPEEKIAFTQQQRAQAVKKVARKKTEATGSPALSAL
jgi:hypothetical protein